MAGKTVAQVMKAQPWKICVMPDALPEFGQIADRSSSFGVPKHLFMVLVSWQAGDKHMGFFAQPDRSRSGFGVS